MMEIRNISVGYKFKPKRSRYEYVVVAIFEDNDQIFYVAKRPKDYGIFEYAHVFFIDKNGNFTEHI